MGYCKTVKLKAYTTRAGYAQVDAVLRDLRLLYNAALEERRTAFKTAGVSIDRKHQGKELTAIRANDPAFGQVDRRLQAEVLERLHLHLKRFSGGSAPVRSQAIPASRDGPIQHGHQPVRGTRLVQVQRA